MKVNSYKLLVKFSKKNKEYNKDHYNKEINIKNIIIIIKDNQDSNIKVDHINKSHTNKDHHINKNQTQINIQKKIVFM